MKVAEIISKVDDIRNCQALMRKWRYGEITKESQIDAIAEGINEHLDDYIKMLVNKEVK